MKAVVINHKGGAPRCVEIPEPAPPNDEEVLLSVKAVALKHFDRSRGRGAHYSNDAVPQGATVIGGDGVGLLADGTRVYAIGVGGMMAEKATVEKNRTVVLPSGLDDSVAAALPNAVIGAAMALRFRAGIEPGDTVLINGATGFTGRVAVQIARHYGAGKIIATGRNPASLEQLLKLGADEVIAIGQADEAFVGRIGEIHRKTPIHVIIDYLWGHTAELILRSIKGDGSFGVGTRFVSVGAMTGDLIQLSAAGLRSIDLQLSGSGLGSWTKGQVRLLFSEILPEMFQLAADGKLVVETVSVALEDIEKLYERKVADGKRVVVLI